MGRKNKKGLEYFNLDVKFSDSVKLCEVEIGPSGMWIMILLWQKIYGHYGYFMEFSDDHKLLFLSDLSTNVKADDFENMLKIFFKRGIFSKSMYEKYKILTSDAIQERYFEACFASKRRNVELNIDYLLVHPKKEIEFIFDVKNDKNNLLRKNAEEIPINSEEININSEEIPINSEFSTQSKVKESKVKKEEEKEEKSSSASTSNFLNQIPKQPVSILIDKLKTQEIFCENCMRELSIKSKEELNTYFDRFKAFLLSLNPDDKKTERDCKLHFMNWLRKNKNELFTNTVPNYSPSASRVEIQQDIPEFITEELKQLYPQNNFDILRLFLLYLKTHNLRVETAITHIRRAKNDNVSLSVLQLKIQSSKELIYNF